MAPVTNHTFKHKKLVCLHRKFTSAVILPEKAEIGYAGSNNFLDPPRILCGRTHLSSLNRTNVKFPEAIWLKPSVTNSNAYSGNNLIQSHPECGQMDNTFKMFDEMPIRNSVAWNLMNTGENNNFHYSDLWRVFCRMHKLGSGMNGLIYSKVLSVCVGLEKVEFGELIHSLVMKNGFYFNDYVTFGVINLYAKSCRAEDSLRVLNDVDCGNVFCWNTVVSGAVSCKDYSTAFGVFHEMHHHDALSPDGFTFSRVLTACIAVGQFEYGKSVHGLAIKSGAETYADVSIGNAIIGFYARSGVVCDAIKQFELMPVQNGASWAPIVHDFVQKGDSGSAVRVLNDMRKHQVYVDKYTVSSVLAVCASPDMFKEMRQIHGLILKNGFYSDPVVQAPLINTYSKAGDFSSSELAFTEARDLQEAGIWGNMISAYIHSKNNDKAIILFCRMLEEGVCINKFVASAVLSIVEDLELGRQIHGYAMKVGILSEDSVGCSVFTMYSKCGELGESIKAFKHLETKDIVSWTSMIAGFAEHGLAVEAIWLFREMGLKDFVVDDKILVAVINACSGLSSLKQGREVHGFTLRCGFSKWIAIVGALVNMYSKHGNLQSAMIIFDRMPVKDPVSWSAIISGFSQRGYVEEALKLSKEMLQSDMSVDSFTISSVVGAVAMSSKPQIGYPLHAHIIKVGLESGDAVGCSILMMYSKCGSIDDCVKAFREIRDPNLVSWTAMIDSFAYHGKGGNALSVFGLMKKLGIKPDDLTFIGVLSACSHAGLVDEGYFHLNSMTQDYGIQPGYKHYACMVDLLGRAGRLEEAERFISSMPIKPDALIWETLLAACKVHGSCEIGKLAAQKIMELQPLDAAAYVTVSNIWAEAGEWEHVQKMRGLMKEAGVRKSESGWSYV